MEKKHRILDYFPRVSDYEKEIKLGGRVKYETPFQSNEIIYGRNIVERTAKQLYRFNPSLYSTTQGKEGLYKVTAKDKEETKLSDHIEAMSYLVITTNSHLELDNNGKINAFKVEKTMEYTYSPIIRCWPEAETKFRYEVEVEEDKPSLWQKYSKSAGPYSTKLFSYSNGSIFPGQMDSFQCYTLLGPHSIKAYNQTSDNLFTKNLRSQKLTGNPEIYNRVNHMLETYTGCTLENHMQGNLKRKLRILTLSNLSQPWNPPK